MDGVRESGVQSTLGVDEDGSGAAIACGEGKRVGAVVRRRGLGVETGGGAVVVAAAGLVRQEEAREVLSATFL
jgi:hypothetical protein